jgi:hypothetical protein
MLRRQAIWLQGSRSMPAGGCRLLRRAFNLARDAEDLLGGGLNQRMMLSRSTMPGGIDLSSVSASVSAA